MASLTDTKLRNAKPTDKPYKLQEGQGLITVTDVISLEKEVTNLLQDDDYRRYYGRHAVDVLHQNQGALQRLLQLLEPHLPPRAH